MANVMSEYANKRIMIPFTGGMDSTLIAHLALEAGCDVVLYSLNISSPQADVEYTCAYEVYEALKEKHPGKVKFRRSSERMPINLDARFQQMATISATLPLVVSSDDDYIAMGWLATDGTWYFADKLKEQFKAAVSWNNDVGVRAEIIFPLIKMCKEEVIDQLPGYLRELVHWCEAPITVDYHDDIAPNSVINYDDGLTIRNNRNNLACGKCPSCRDICTARHSLFPLSTWYSNREAVFKRFRFTSKREMEVIYRLCRKAVGGTKYEPLPRMNELFDHCNIPHPFYKDIQHEYGSMFRTEVFLGRYRISEGLVGDKNTAQHAARTLAMAVRRKLDLPASEKAADVVELTDLMIKAMKEYWKLVYPYRFTEVDTEFEKQYETKNPIVSEVSEDAI